MTQVSQNVLKLSENRKGRDKAWAWFEEYKTNSDTLFQCSK
jgi:hypothetical protein